MAAPDTSADPDREGASALPRWGLAAILSLALLLQLDALSLIHGYPIADSIEFLERAGILLDGAPLWHETVRSFSFSALLVPVVAVGRLFGPEGALWAGRLMQMVLGLATIVVVGRTAARLVSPRAGLIAAFILAVNPVFLQWTIEPLSGTAAMLCSALAVQAATRRGGFRRGLAVGVWSGLGALMAFQVLLLFGVLILALALRERWSGRAYLTGAVLGITLMLVLQAIGDGIVFGSFGLSLLNYLHENGAGLLATKLYELGQLTGIDALSQLGLDLYNAAFEADDLVRQESRASLTSKSPRLWYLAHLPTHLFAWPMLVIVGLGIARAGQRAHRGLALLVFIVAVNVLVMSLKGSQSFRLWLPLLPMLAVLGGAGWSWLAGPSELGAMRRLGAGILLAAGAVMGVGILHGTNLRQHGGYWDAMDYVFEQAEGDAGAIAAGYHWAIRYRNRPGVEHREVKFSYPLYTWSRLAPDQRAMVIEELDDLEWFIAHQQLIEQDPGFAAQINRRFKLEAAFYEKEAFEDLLPVLVFRRSPGTEGRRLFGFEEAGDPAARQARLAHSHSIDMRREVKDGSLDQMVILGWEVEVLAGSENVGWLTVHGYAGSFGDRDYTIEVRVTDPDDRARQFNLPPLWGTRPTSTWPEGALFQHSIPFRLSAGWDDFGGAYCRGDLVPTRLWLAVRHYKDLEVDEPLATGNMFPFLPSGTGPVERMGQRGLSVFTQDGFVLMGGFFAPLTREARIPDDGKPLGSG